MRFTPKCVDGAGCWGSDINFIDRLIAACADNTWQSLHDDIRQRSKTLNYHYITRWVDYLRALCCITFSHPRYDDNPPPFDDIQPSCSWPPSFSCYGMLPSTISFPNSICFFLIIWPKKPNFLDTMDSMRLLSFSALSVTRLLVRYVTMRLSKYVWDFSFQKLG